ncbi:hypothetical protein GCK32_014876, partial [Trichostrongylus colubriformis]
MKKRQERVEEPDNYKTTPELEELRRFAATIRHGGSELERRAEEMTRKLDTALIDLAGCQSQLVRSVAIEKYEKLALRYKKECVAEVLDSELDEAMREHVVSISPPNHGKTDELEAKNTYLKVNSLSREFSFIAR